MRKSKKYRIALEKVNKGKEYSPLEAIRLVQEMKATKFDGTLEGHFNIYYKSTQNVKGGFQFPHGTGKITKVLVFAKGDKASEAKQAGADYVGDEELMKKVGGGWTDFQFVVATPDMMKEVGKLGPVLGKKGLMPKPKSGTVTMDVGSTVKKLKSGWLEYKADKSGVVHMPIGKLSFQADALLENVETAYGALMKDKPSDAKGQYISSLYISGTMTPSVRVNAREMKN